MGFKKKIKKKINQLLHTHKDDDTSARPADTFLDVQQQSIPATNTITSSSAPNDLSGTQRTVSFSAAANPPQNDPQEETTRAPLLISDNGKAIRQLWEEAYNQLANEKEKLIKEFEDKIKRDLSAALGEAVGTNIAKRDWMNAILKRKMDQIDQNVWKLKFRSSEVLVRDVVKPVLGVVARAKDFITEAVSGNPIASIAWGGVSLLLPFLLNPSKQIASLAQGLEYISSLIVQSYLWEDLYERRYKSTTITHHYRLALEKLYQHILEFQITGYCYFTRHTAARYALDVVEWTGWKELLQSIKDQEKVLFQVLDRCRDIRYDEESRAAKQRHEQIMSCWQRIGTDTSGLLTGILKAQEDDKRTKLLDWLSTVAYSARFNDARSNHQKNTSKWLVEDSKTFATWKQQPKSFLWLNGKAGSGKSVLSSSVIQHLRDQYQWDPSAVVSYYFFNFRVLEQQKVTVMLSSLVRQLCASRPDTPQPIKCLEKYIARNERPGIKTLENAFIATVHGFSAVFIIIDALDECPTFQNERSKLLGCLSRVIDAMPDNVHIFCTSRAEPDIQAEIDPILSRPARTAISLTGSEELDNDLSLYIDSVLASRTYSPWPEEMKIKAKESLIKRADGMFQYLVTQFDTLKNLQSAQAIQDALDDLPEGLDDTYDRILNNVEAKFEKQVLGALKWLSRTSAGYFTVKELAEVFVFNPESADELNHEKRLFKPKSVLQYFSSLVMVDRYHGGVYDNMSTVRLAHFTIKEYLNSDRIRNRSTARFHFTDNDALLHITHFCLSYHVNVSAKETRPIEKRRSFGGATLFYEANEWEQYLKMIDRDLWTPEIVCLAQRALSIRSESLRISVRTRGPSASRIKALQPVARGYAAAMERQASMWRRPYCYTAWIGSLELTKLLIHRASEPNMILTQEDLDAAFLEAVIGGHDDIVRFLLEKGADIKVWSQRVGGALQAAALFGHLSTIELLLEEGADMNANYGDIGSVLEAAAHSCQFGVLDLLLKRGADVHKAGCAMSIIGRSSDGRIKTEQGLRISQLLVDKGANVNYPCTKYGTALSAAAKQTRRGGSKDLFDFLLRTGANVNLSSGRHGHPLQAACLAACWTPNEFISMLHSNILTLLDKGAEVNAQGGEYGNALQAACYAKDIVIVRLLLEHDANVNARGGRFETALIAACFRRCWDIVDLLLEKGADVTIQGGELGDVLQALCEGRYEPKAGAFQQLCEKGANVHATGGKYGSPLHAASANPSVWSYDMVGELLSKGADVDKQEGLYGTALQSACMSANLDKIRLLLENKAQVNMEGGKYGTALQAACAPENLDVSEILRRDQDDEQTIVSLLIEYGADVHVRGGIFGSAWHAAATKLPRVNGTLEILLAHHVDVNDCGGLRHGTALQAALELFGDPSDAIPRISFLLERGADVNMGAGPYGFPLQSACMVSEGTHGLAFLLENRRDEIDVDRRGGLFGTALQAAVHEGNTDAVEMLLNNGADVTIRNGKYGSALNAAVIRGYWDLVDILMAAGAEPDCHHSAEPDEEWLERVEKEDGRGAVEYYRKFWELKKLESDKGKAVDARKE